MAIIPLTLAAYIINWPAAVLAPALACKLLSKPALPQGLLPKLCILAALAFGGGYLLAFLTAPHPALNLLLIIVFMYILYQKAAEGLNHTVVLVFLLGMLVVPLFGITSLDLAYAICICLIQAVLLAVATVALAHTILPATARDRATVVQQPTATNATPPDHAEDELFRPLRATLTMIPMILYCSIGNHPEAKLVLIYSIIYSLDPAAYGRITQAKEHIRSCLIAGLLAAISYEVISAVPHIPMHLMIVVICLTLLIRRSFAESDRASLYASATTTFIVLLGGTFNVNGNNAGEVL